MINVLSSLFFTSTSLTDSLIHIHQKKKLVGEKCGEIAQTLKHIKCSNDWTFFIDFLSRIYYVLRPLRSLLYGVKYISIKILRFKEQKSNFRAVDKKSQQRNWKESWATGINKYTSARKPSHR